MDAVVSSLKTYLGPIGVPTQYIDRDNIIIALLVLYIASISVWTPRAILAFFNQPAIRVATLVLIIWVFTWNKLLAIVIAIAFVATMSIDQSIIISKAIGSVKKIVDRTEHFENVDSEDDQEYQDDEASDEDQDHEDFEDGHDHSGDDNHDEDEDNYDEEDENLKKRDLTDTFRNLHDSIHKLEQFISKNKKE